MKNDNNSKKLIERAGAVVIALALWQIIAMVINQKILLVTPVAVAKRLLTIWMEDGFFASIGFTLGHIAAGFFAGVLVGSIIAFLAYKVPIIESLMWPWIAAIKAVPVASFVVICLIWLSPSHLSVLVSFLIVLPMVYQNILSGLKNLDIKMLEMAEVFRLPWYKKLSAIIVPELRPYIISACKITAGMAWKAGVAAEVIGTPNGSIGRELYLSKVYLDTDDLLAWTVIIVAISVLFEKLFIWLLSKVIGDEHEVKCE